MGQEGDAAAPATRGLWPPLYAFLYLPGGLSGGFITVTLSFVLARRGVSVAAIAGLISLSLIPATVRFILGPAVDLVLDAKTWFRLALTALIATFISLGAAPLTPQGMPLIGLLGFLLCAAGTLCSASATLAMLQTTPDAQRGAVAGWSQTGNLAGASIGGGAGLWLAVHAGGVMTAALALSGTALLCLSPILWLRLPSRERRVGFKGKAAEVRQGLLAVVRTRRGVLVGILCVLPAGLGAAFGLLPAVAGDWGAGADLVALVTGVLGGLVTLPGCVAAGYLCDRFPRRACYVAGALASAAGEALFAILPHTPSMFAALTLANGFLLGLAYAGVSAIIFDGLSVAGAATVSTLLASLSTLPVMLMTLLVGFAQTRWGSGAMLLTEAFAGLASMGAYVALAVLWRPAPAHRGLSAAAA